MVYAIKSSTGVVLKTTSRLKVCESKLLFFFAERISFFTGNLLT